MTYIPSSGPNASSPEGRALLVYLQRELNAIAMAMATIEATQYTLLGREPTKPRAGLVVAADGVGWNPGSGAGLYVYTVAGAWALVVAL